MSRHQEVTYTLDVRARGREPKTGPTGSQLAQAAAHPIPRIARLLALAIRWEGLLRNQTIRDYAELSRLGGVTRARMTQIMQLLDLAPDIQEQILFLPRSHGINERNLRPVLRRIDWTEQRRLFQHLTSRADRTL